LDSVASEGSSDSAGDELQQKLEDLSIAQEERTELETGSETATDQQQSDNKCETTEQQQQQQQQQQEKQQEQVTMGDVEDEDEEEDTLTFDLSPGEEAPDMGHNVWRESVVSTSGRGEQLEKIEKKLQFGGEEDAEDVTAVAEEGVDNDDGACEGDCDEPEQESEDIHGEGADDNNEDNNGTESEEQAPSDDSSVKEKYIPAYARPTAVSAQKVNRPKSKRKTPVVAKSNSLTRAQSGAISKTPSKVISDLPTSPDSASKFMAPTASFTILVTDEEAKQKERAKTWEESLRRKDPTPKKGPRVESKRDKMMAYDPKKIKAMRDDTKTLLPDGRPSIDTMSAQVYSYCLI
jgi:hypothetical protein